jgi:3-oxoacyl-[acyl-carrier protein] reductase
MNKEHNKRIVVISGGAGYVGSAVAKKLREQGMVVAVLYRKEQESTLSSLPKGEHRAFVCDITSEEEVAQTLATIEQTMGVIYACVHVAGTKPVRKQLSNTTKEEFEDAFQVNTFGAFSFLSACARILKSHKEGVMVGVTTAGVIIPEATNSLGGYLPAKYALQGMLTMFKEELRSSHIRVYSVAPGFMEEGMNSDIPKAFVQMILAKSSKKRLTTAEDVAETIAYLCSDDATKEEALTHVVAREYED